MSGEDSVVLMDAILRVRIVDSKYLEIHNPSKRIHIRSQ